MGIRDSILVQTKCGLIRGNDRTAAVDTSKKHILESAEGSLKRLGMDYIDVYMLHSADSLIEPDEVGEAFEILHSSGKVRHFGVSNYRTRDISYLQSNLKQKIIINQLQLGVGNTDVIDSANSIKLTAEAHVETNGGVLAYMREHDMTVQAWSPLQVKYYGGIFMGDKDYPLLNEETKKIAEKYGVSQSAIGIAWILRHPAKIQPLLGSMNVERIVDMCTADKVELTREDWYGIYIASLLDEGKFQTGSSAAPPKR